MGEIRQRETKDDLKIIICGRLLDGIESEDKVDQAIVIKGDRVTDIVPAHSLSGAEENREVFDLSAYTVLPGLVDTHVHIESDAETDFAIFDRSIAKRTLEAARIL